MWERTGRLSDPREESSRCNKTRGLNTVTVRGLLDGMLVPALSYGCETLEWHEYKKSRVRALEMDVLRSVYRF